MAVRDRQQIIIFGDLTCDSVAGLGSLVAIKDNPLLTSFFEKVTFGLREEIGRLPFEQRQRFVRFITIEELLARVKQLACPHPALEKALACTYQFACFIRYYTSPGQRYPSPHHTCLVGLCTGLLTAAAVGCCQSITDLIPLATHTILVAFRTGLFVADVRDRIEPQTGSPASWSVLVPGLGGDTALSVLGRYSKEKGLPTTSAPYISTYASAGVTLSGPPSALEDVLRSDYLLKNRSLAIPIYAPYHASHLYGHKDIDNVLRGTAGTGFASRQCQFRISSPITGQAIDVDTFEALISHALNGILREPLQLERIVSSLGEALATSSLTKGCTILPIATLAGQSFAAALKEHEVSDVTVDPCMNSSIAVRDDRTSTSGHLGHSKLAIIGYSGRFPDANSNDEFWQLLHEGRDVASTAPNNRWDVKTHVDPTLKRKNTMGTPYGCWLKDPGLFDARFFALSPREAPQTDPAQRLSLMTAYEAMEFAGFVPDSSPSTQSDRIGVFYGTTSNDWGETNSSQNVDTYYIPGSCRAFIPGRQNFFYKFSGPSYSVDTACSSGLAALHLACNSLLKGDIDTAICGGTNVLTNPDITAGLDRGHFLSRTGNCKTFDDDADGYCRGEGVCTFVIKRLEDATADNDPIIAVILGAYTNHSAEAESITRPHVGAQKAVFEKILTSASVDPYSVGYVEMHGTGTQAGDAREMKSVLSIFAPETKRPRSDEERLFLGSAKANVGHGESVSGPIALIKSLMILERNEIPPHCGIKNKINSGFPTDLEDRNVHIAKRPVPWARPEGCARRIMINNFSAAGGNSSVLIEDAPVLKPKPGLADPRSTYIVAVSAKSSTALEANIRSLLSYMTTAKPPLPSLSYTTTARRMHHPFRVMVAGSELAEVHALLENKLLSPAIQARTRASQRVAFAFTGQGSQYIGMGRDLLKFSTFRGDLERFDAIVQTLGFPSISPLIEESEVDIYELQPLVVQVGTVCIQIAMARLWISWGLEPCAVVGHSLGEYAALNIAGVLSEADTIFVAGKRAQLLQDDISSNTHAMLAISTGVEEAQSLCNGLEYDIACINTPRETVLSGTNEQIDKILDILSSTNLKTTRLRVPFAFHSSQMQSILVKFKAATRGVKFREPKVPVLSPLLGEILTSKEPFGPEYLARHCRETVNFAAALDSAKADGLISNAIWIEIGAHPIVSGLLKNNLDSTAKTVPTLQRCKDTWKVLSSSLSVLYESGVEVRWPEYHRDFISALSVLRLPSYNWDLKEYWMQYVNDWSLYKGDAMFLKGVPGLSTTCVHRLVEEKKEGNKITVVGEVDVLRDDMDPFVRGHRVNNLPLVTPSVYAEMALVIGEYLRKQQTQLVGALVDLQHMDVQRPFATKSKGKGPQLLQCHILLDCQTLTATVEFWSVTPEGKKLVRHALASIAFPDAKAAQAEVQQRADSILAEMDDMAARLSTDDRVQKFTGKTGYNLVSSLASYDSEFMGVSSVILDSSRLEATATVKFNNPRTDGVYHVNPYVIDNLGQPALFVMNANDRADLSKEVFVNHGWKSLHFYKPLSITNTYRSHVKMTGPDNDGLYGGDMVVFEGKEVVAVYKGIKAQGVPRRLMDYIVHMRDDTKAGAPTGGTLQIGESTASTSAAGGSLQTTPPASGSDNWQAALKIISEESGVPISELSPEAAFDDLGVDSLLALLCASRFREELGLHYESSIFLDHPTIRNLEAFWKQGAPEAGTVAVSGRDAALNSMFAEAEIEMDQDKGSSDEGRSASEASSYEVISHNTIETSPETSSMPSPKVSATSLLLQGNPAVPSTVKTLFLLPDGSGSCSSYAGLPRIHPSIAVVGVNCPFMKTPESYTCTIDEVAQLYITEIRRRQPHGPYALGGWSVGGIFAYHIAQQLAAQGEQVTELVLIDCPVPKGLDHLPHRYYEYCDTIGLLGDVNGVKRDPPPWLISHFEACVNSLHSYRATPYTSNDPPRTQIIWACDAIDKHCEPKFERRPEDPEGLKFLTATRTDFGPCGWDSLLPEEDIVLDRMTGANHFSMMKGEFAKRLSEMIEGFLMIGN
ncbi:beta-ketoacyl synthase [Aspergillus alliaceus]|uniref:beta-ketoacyl synthase n=1 Tax=Petromyces alliaceus TaxID=209559 RepID=UPI0012A49FD5|nr:beta-ketoacyl synthase [Aspergillus alliaceus]KAB8239545.1 beta-ketoacyl synthase [Aspergillus alliaceus]